MGPTFVPWCHGQALDLSSLHRKCSLCPPELVFKLVCIVPGCPYVALIKMNPLDRLYKDSRCTLQA